MVLCMMSVFVVGGFEGDHYVSFFYPAGLLTALRSASFPDGSFIIVFLDGDVAMKGDLAAVGLFFAY